MAVRGITLDLVKKGFLMNFWNAAYNFVSAKVQNDTTLGAGSGVGEVDLVGQLVKDNAGVWELVPAGDEADAEGVIVVAEPIDPDNLVAANGLTPFPCAILVRGPAVIRASAIPTTDAYGNDYDADDYKAALLVLDIVTAEISAVTVEQTT